MARWAHILWQRHNLRPEEFERMSRPMQLFYIASELEENREPVRRAVFIGKPPA